jgi:hypothetical protein
MPDDFLAALATALCAPSTFLIFVLQRARRLLPGAGASALPRLGAVFEVLLAELTANTPQAGSLGGRRYFGITLGSPPGVPGGGTTGITPPPTAGAEMPGSTPAGGQITPFERDSWSLRLALPVVSPGADKAAAPLWQS